MHKKSLSQKRLVRDLKIIGAIDDWKFSLQNVQLSIPRYGIFYICFGNKAHVDSEIRVLSNTLFPAVSFPVLQDFFY